MEGQVKGYFRGTQAFKEGYHKRVNGKKDHDDTNDQRHGSQDKEEKKDSSKKSEERNDESSNSEAIIDIPHKRPVIDSFPVTQLLHKKELLKRQKQLQYIRELKKKTVSFLFLFRAHIA